MLRFQIFDYLGGEIYVDTVGTGVAQMQVSEIQEEHCGELAQLAKQRTLGRGSVCSGRQHLGP